MDCATEVISMPVGGLPASTYTPPPQTGDKTYDVDLVDSTQTAVHSTTACVESMHLQSAQPQQQQQQAIQMQTVQPQYYAQYYPHHHHQYTQAANGQQYSPALMYMPVPHAYYPHMTRHQQHFQSQHSYAPTQTTGLSDYASMVHAGQQANATITSKTTGGQVVEPPTIVKTPSRQRVVIWNYCQFCQNNREPEEFFRGHILRDADGKVVCPVLRAYNCPICNNGGGDKAHTKSYCPQLRTSRMPPRRTSLFH